MFVIYYLNGRLIKSECFQNVLAQLYTKRKGTFGQSIFCRLLGSGFTSSSHLRWNWAVCDAVVCMQVFSASML